jgi:hypothetical protein
MMMTATKYSSEIQHNKLPVQQTGKVNNNNWLASFRNPPMITSIFPSQLTKATVSCSDHGFKNDESLA